MKHVIRYQVLTIPQKLRCDVRIIVDDRSPVFVGGSADTKSTTISIRPFVALSIIRPTELDENGQRIRGQWDPNDNLSMTKYNMPVFLEEFKAVYDGMKIPELYTYHGSRLDLNEEVAKNVKKSFMIGPMTIEISPQVIIQNDDSRVEGVKLKFNNEQHTVSLTLNDMTALLYTLDHMDMDTLGFMMYNKFASNPNGPTTFTPFDFNQ